MKTKFLKTLCVGTALTLCLLPLASCNQSNPTTSQEVQAKGVVVTSSNGHCVISLSDNVDENGEVSLNQTVTVNVEVDDGYSLESLFVNNVDITETKSFEVKSASIYSIVCYVTSNASVEGGQSLVELSLPSMIGIGDTQEINSTIYGPNTEITYTSTDSTVVSIENGSITGLKPGFASITGSVTDKDGNQVSDSSLVFVAPEYIEKMITYYQEFDIVNGIELSLPINVSLSGGIPVTVNNTLDLQVDANSNFYMYGQTGLNILGFMSLDLEYYSLNDIENNLPYMVGYKTISNVKTPVMFNEVNPSVSMMDIVNILPLLGGLLGGGSLEGGSIDTSTIAVLLNSLLTFSTDPSQGIALSPAGISLLNDLYKQIDFSSLGDMGPLLGMMMPTEIASLKYTVTLDEEGNYESMDLNATALFSNLSDPSQEPSEASFLQATLDGYDKEFTSETKESIATSHATLLEAQVSKDSYIEQVNELDTISSFLGDEARENVKYQEKVASLWETYESLNNETKGLITGEGKDFMSLLSVSSLDNKGSSYTPWMVLNMTKDETSIDDGSKVNVGDTISLDLEVLGYYQDVNLDYTVELSLDDKTLNVEDYVSYSKENQTITILQSFADKELTLSMKVANSKTQSGLTIGGVIVELVF